MTKKDLLKKIEELELENIQLKKENENLRQVNKALMLKAITKPLQNNKTFASDNSVLKNGTNFRNKPKSKPKTVTTYTEANAKDHIYITKKEPKE